VPATPTSPETTERDLPAGAGPVHRTTDELRAFLPALLAAPREVGTVRLVVARPGPGAREVLDEGRFDAVVGLVGDDWSVRGNRHTADGGPHPLMQVTVVNDGLAAFLAGDLTRQSLLGDQLHVDLDLSHANLPAHSRLAIGEPGTGGAELEVTEAPHTGCAKFVARFGAEAMAFVNGRTGRPLRLRGLNARVVVSGRVRPGDAVHVRRP
jgi:MOSC domain-containing protein YiiM